MSLDEKILIEKLWTNYENSILMLKDRGYSIMNFIKKEDFLNININKINLIAETSSDKIYLTIFPLVESFRKRDFTNIIRESPSNINHIIIVADINVRYKRIKGFITSVPEKRIEIISSKTLNFPLTKHIVMPSECKLLTEEEKNSFLISTRIMAKNLPKIFTSDPLVIWYGACPGQIFKIKRKFNIKNALSETIYRIVVDEED